MLRLMPSAVATGELLARPATGVDGLGRLTAPTRSPWFWLALWVSSAAAGFVALIPALSDHGPPVQAHDVLHDLSGVSFAACGLAAWRRRPDSAVGAMLTIRGFGVLRSALLDQVGSSLAFTVSLLFCDLWIALYAALI